MTLPAAWQALIFVFYFLAGDVFLNPLNTASHITGYTTCSGVKPPYCVSTVIETPSPCICHWHLLGHDPLGFNEFPGTLIVATYFEPAAARQSMVTSFTSRATSRTLVAPTLSQPLGMPRALYVSALAFSSSSRPSNLGKLVLSIDLNLPCVRSINVSLVSNLRSSLPRAGIDAFLQSKRGARKPQAGCFAFLKRPKDLNHFSSCRTCSDTITTAKPCECGIISSRIYNEVSSSNLCHRAELAEDFYR